MSDEWGDKIESDDEWGSKIEAPEEESKLGIWDRLARPTDRPATEAEQKYDEETAEGFGSGALQIATVGTRNKLGALGSSLVDRYFAEEDRHNGINPERKLPGILEEYEAAKPRIKQFYSEKEKMAPVAAFAGGMIAGAPMAIAAAPLAGAFEGAPALARVAAAAGDAGLFGGANALGASEAQTIAGKLSDTATGAKDAAEVGVALAGAPVAALKTAKGSLVLAQWLMKLPQRAQEAAFRQIGRSGLGKMIDDAAGTSVGKALSERVTSLMQNIDNAEKFEPNRVPSTNMEEGPLYSVKDRAARDLGAAAARGDATIGPGSSFTAKAEPGLSDDLYNIGRQTTERSANKAFGPMSGTQATPFENQDFAVQGLLKKSLASAESEGAEMPHGPTALEADKPEWWDNHWRSVDDAGSEAAGERYGDALTGRDRAVSRGQSMNGVMADEHAWHANKKIDVINKASREALEDRDIAMTGVMNGAKKWQAKIQAAKEAASQVDVNNKMELARLNAIAEQAQGELNEINSGRRVAEKVAGAFGGAGAGYASGTFIGGPAVGVPGALGGLWKGYDSGLPVGRNADAMAGIGNNIGKIGALAEQWATRDDALGRAAKWALSGGGDQSSVRLGVLASLPEAQEEIGTDR